MKLCASSVGIALISAMALVMGTTIPVLARSHDNETKLMAKLQRETNPVRKAKIEVKLGRLKLHKAFSAYSDGHYDDCWKLLDDYQSYMEKAWADLQASGKNAAKKSDGFKQLDIGLRESRRDMEDFETRITYDERKAVEKIRLKTENLHNRVLTALFPAMAPKKNRKRSPKLSTKNHPQIENGE
jgi:hypothetical protein